IKAEAPPRLVEYALSVAILSYTHTSRRCSSVVTMLGEPKMEATSEEGIPTRISFCTFPTVKRSPSSLRTCFKCDPAEMQAPTKMQSGIRELSENVDFIWNLVLTWIGF